MRITSLILVVLLHSFAGPGVRADIAPLPDRSEPILPRENPYYRPMIQAYNAGVQAYRDLYRVYYTRPFNWGTYQFAHSIYIRAWNRWSQLYRQWRDYERRMPVYYYSQPDRPVASQTAPRATGSTGAAGGSSAPAAEAGERTGAEGSTVQTNGTGLNQPF